MESEEDEEEFEEIIDDDAEDEAEVGEATDVNVKGAGEENTCYGLGSRDRPLVRFYFTTGCPELGLKPPQAGGCPIGGRGVRWTS